MMQRAALAYSARGKCIFPCRPRDKTPLTPHGCLDASSNPEQVRAWWAVHPNANIGLATGKRSGLWVLDIDGEQGGASLRALELANGGLPATVEAITGGGGRHLFFRMPEGIEIKCSAGALGAGLDVRGDGGYVIVPPSIHPCGRPYAWSIDCAPAPADAPAWLLDELQRRQSGRQPDSYWTEIVKRGLPEGLRNVTTLSALGKLIGAGIHPAFAHDLVQCWNAQRGNPPLEPKIITEQAKRVLRLEMKKRGLS
jgi:hypothetical protein